MPAPKKFLVCPLDWGLGHATRLVPVVEALLRRGAQVILAADHRPYEFLAGRFPGCKLVRLGGYSPRYPEHGSMALNMLREFPKMKRSARKANKELQTLVRELGIDAIISDNRYELFSKDAYNIFISHQLNIQTPGFTRLFKPFIQHTITSYIRHFDELWIPDVEGDPNLSGSLSRPRRFPVPRHFFIGPLSRFSLLETVNSYDDIDLLVLLSGPEPQRSILEREISSSASQTALRTVILQGKPEDRGTVSKGNIRYVAHADDATIAGMIRSARFVISRPGYSTLMDLAILGKQAIFIPTPGQTEQIYLARRLEQFKLFYRVDQDDIDLPQAIERSKDYGGMNIKADNKVLHQRLDEIMSGL